MCVDCMDLYAFPSACTLQRGRFDVVGQIRDDYGKTRKTIDQTFALPRSTESLQQSLDDDSCREQ